MINRVLEARKVILATYVLAVAGGLWLSLSLTIDPNNRVFFGAGHEHFRDLEDLEARFSSNTNLFFVLDAQEGLFDLPALSEALRWLTAEVWRIERVVGVDSVVNYPHVTSVGDEVETVDVIDFVCPEGGCRESRAYVFDKPLLKNRLVVPGANVFAVVARLDLVDPEVDVVGHISSQADDLLADFEDRFPEVSIYLTGGVPMMQAFFVAAQNDSAALLPAVVLVLSVGLYFFLGGFIPASFMIVLGLSAVILTMGVAAAFGLTINTATATVPLIVFTLVVAAAMHVFLHVVREERLDDNASVVSAVRTAFNSNWRPVLLTAGTTALGLLSMVFVSAPPLRELGVLSAFGVAAGAILSLTVVPCLFSLLPRLHAANYLSVVQASMNRYAGWLENHKPKWMVVVTALVLCVAVAGIFKVRVDEDFVRYFSESSEFRAETEEITDLIAGPYHVDVVYDSGRSAGLFSEESVSRLNHLVALLRSQPEVVSAVSVLDVLRDISAAFGGTREIERLQADELAQLFLTYELSLDIGQSTRDLVDSDQRRGRVAVLLGDVSMADIRSLESRISSEAEQRGLGDQVIVTGEGIPTAHLSSESIREMATGIALSIFASVLLVGIYFRSLAACLTIFSATALPIIAGFGVWGWLESDIGMAATLVVATTIGVVVDDTIHLTYRFIDGLRNLDLTPWGATAYAIHKAGTAIVVTSLVLVAGLLVLVVSDFRMNSTFGTCASLVIALALLYNLLIAPRLLSTLR